MTRYRSRGIPLRTPLFPCFQLSSFNQWKNSPCQPSRRERTNQMHVLNFIYLYKAFSQWLRNGIRNVINQEVNTSAGRRSTENSEWSEAYRSYVWTEELWSGINGSKHNDRTKDTAPVTKNMTQTTTPLLFLTQSKPYAVLFFYVTT